MTRLIVLILMVLCIPVYAADVTKSAGQLLDWTLLDDTGGNPFIETNVLDTEGLRSDTD